MKETKTSSCVEPAHAAKHDTRTVAARKRFFSSLTLGLRMGLRGKVKVKDKSQCECQAVSQAKAYVTHLYLPLRVEKMPLSKICSAGYS